jgi:hypothetical protein
MAEPPSLRIADRVRRRVHAIDGDAPAIWAGVADGDVMQAAGAGHAQEAIMRFDSKSRRMSSRLDRQVRRGGASRWSEQPEAGEPVPGPAAFGRRPVGGSQIAAATALRIGLVDLAPASSRRARFQR